MTLPLQRSHQPIKGFSNFSQLGGYGVQAHVFPLIQTTEHGPALARRSLWVSVPGAPQRATFSDACATPLVRAGLDSFPAPLAVGATSFRAGGSRWRTERQHVLCDRHLSDASPDLSALGRGAYLPRQNDPLSQGLFSFHPHALQSGVGQFSERLECQLRSSVVVNQSHTWSPQWSFARSAVFCRNT